MKTAFLLALSLLLTGFSVYYPLPNGGKVIFQPTLQDFKEAKSLFSDERVLKPAWAPFALVVRE